MSDRFFEPTATKMTTFSLGKAAAATPRENKKPTSQPPNLPRAYTADARREWNGQNPPDRSRDLRILARQPPHRRNSTTSSQSMSSGATKTPTIDGHGLFLPIPSRGEETAPPGAFLMPRNPSRLSVNTNWVQRNPPTLIEDEEGLLPSHNIPQSPHGTSRSTSTPPQGQKGSCQRKPNNRGHLKLPSTSFGRQPTTPSDDCEEWTWLIHIITPPPRERTLRSRAHVLTPTETTPNYLRLDFEPSSQRGGEERSFNEARRITLLWTLDNDGDTTTTQWGKLTAQFTAPCWLKMLRESSAERRRLLSTIIDHFMYEVILW
jgi:hypothetical protein